MVSVLALQYNVAILKSPVLAFDKMTIQTRQQASSALFVRGIPPETVRKLRAAAALTGKGFPAYLKELLENHVVELERKGILPRSRG